MDESQVMQLLFEDISRLELPPISEKVLIAIRQKKQKTAENSLIYPVVERKYKAIPTKYLFTAMLTLLVVSVPIIVVLTNKAPVSNAPNYPILPNSKEIASIAESQVGSTVDNETTLERIKLKQIYGEVALSSRTEKELETLLVTYSKESHVYEDDQYIYNFDSSGNLREVLNKHHSDELSVRVTKEIIKSISENMFEMYFPEKNITSYQLEIISNNDTLPEWIINYKNNNDETIRMTFDKSGMLRMIILIGSGDSFGNISKAQAIKIVLRELRNEKYKLLDFENKDVEIIVNTKEIDNRLYYEVNVDKIPYRTVNNEKYFAWYQFVVDSDTGAYLLVDYMI